MSEQYYLIRAINGSVVHATNGGHTERLDIVAICGSRIRNWDAKLAGLDTLPPCPRCARILAADGVEWPQKAWGER